MRFQRTHVLPSSVVAAALLAGAGMSLSGTTTPGQAIAVPAPVATAAPAVSPTIHPPVAGALESLWLTPSASDRAAVAGDPALARLQAAIRLHRDSRHEQALTNLIATARARSPLADYANYYAALTELRMERFDAARRRFADVADDATEGYLAQAAALGEAEAAEGLHDYAAAIQIYEHLLESEKDRATLLNQESIWLDLATAAAAAGDFARAANAYFQLYYGFPLSELAPQAEGPLARLNKEVEPLASGNTRYRLELRRAERLFAARRYADARTSFQRVRPHATGDDRELVALRLAACDYYTARYVAARDALRRYLSSGSRPAEARFFYLMGARGLKADLEFVKRARALAEDFPDSPWTEEALNNLATYHIQRDQDEEADAVLRELYAKFPQGRFAERAAWKIGWRSYLAKRPADTAEYFERTAAAFPRSDYRPSYLYWAGRSREAAGARALAVQRYAVAVADYLNTYYGRLAAAALARLAEPRPPSNLMFHGLSGSNGQRGTMAGSIEDEGLPPNADVIRALLGIDLYDEAMSELQFAQKAWGDSPALQATIAWTLQRQGELRPGINAMKRAYPQYMAAGGEGLPHEILTVIFPVAYWDQIRRQAAQHKLDPYLLAALVAQESNFDPVIRSSANAYGLMQLLPSTARRYARRLKIPYSARLLTTAESNLRLGTAYFADLLDEFGSAHFALAGYNAGEGRVRRWRLERPGFSPEEFIDDIPFPETQNYVKRILGTAEDYRRLYGTPQ